MPVTELRRWKKETGNTLAVSCKVSPRVFKALDDAAWEGRLTVSEVVRRALVQYLKLTDEGDGE